MATLDWDCTVENGVTLVRLVVRTDRREQVRVDSRLDGPVWPPRTDGVPETGWDENGYEGVVDGRTVLGYASPAAPAEPPAAIASATPVRDGDATESTTTPADVLRTLGEARPPRAAVPDGVGADSGSVPSRTETGPERDGGEGTEPPRVAPWFETVELRVETAEELAAATSVEEARSAVAAAGGVDAVRSLRSQLRNDRETLSEMEQRAGDLRERIAGADVPVETLARLA